MVAAWKVRAEGFSREPDLDEARVALALLADPGAPCELFSLFPAAYTALPGADLDGLTAWSGKHQGSLGNFVSVNPLVAGYAQRPGGGGLVDDFARRRWLALDVDPVRPGKDCNATEGEREAARAVQAAATAFLLDRGAPDPVLIDTGNGWHCLYRVDLPNDPEARALLARLLRALAGAFDTAGATLDAGAARVTFHARLPGFWNRKGPHEGERPQRMARLARIPATLEVFPRQLLEELAGPAPERRQPRPKAWRQKAEPTGREAAYVRPILERECARLAAERQTRNDVLASVAFILGQWAWLLGADLIESELRAACEANGLAQDEPRKTRDTIRRQLAAGMKEPRAVPDDGPAPAASANGHAGAGANGKEEAPATVILRASEVEPEKVEFLWPDRIPLGMLTTFAGVTSLGKTFVLCDVAARVTTGAGWPGGGECGESGQVLFLTGEDSLAKTIVPRLIEAGADLKKVVFIKPEVLGTFSLRDLDTLSSALEQMGGDCRLVVIDPPTAFMPPDVDDHKNASLRTLLTPLASWAEEHDPAVLMNTHFSKATGPNVNALARVMGSVAWVNAVRAAHMFARDPEDPERRLYLPLKLNVGKEPKGLAYRIVPSGRLARVEWLGPVEISADEAAGSKGPSRCVIATEWLVERFREKLEWPSNDLFQAARQDGVSRDAIFEAKARLDLPRARRNVNADGSTVFVWWVPKDWPPLNEDTPKTPPIAF